MYEIQKSGLPPSELGDDRCFQIEYFGHGDILMAAWNGALDLDPSANDGVSVRFGLAHGSDVIILASLAGYLKRLGRSDDEVRETMHEAGKEILHDDSENLRFYRSLWQGYVNRIADGESHTRFDVPAMRLACLVLPTPSQPGLIEQTGGTGIYTKNANDNNTLLVLAGLIPATDLEGKKVVEINRTVEFCEHDIPTMARLVCDLALGEYRRDLHSFLVNLYLTEVF